MKQFTIYADQQLDYIDFECCLTSGRTASEMQWIIKAYISFTGKSKYDINKATGESDITCCLV